MILTNDQLKELRLIELVILKEFIRVCSEMNLRYYILYGTLLGAVRHGGFIPWDDDIDVGMPREDYDRFIREAQSFFPQNLFVQSIYTDSEYNLSFAKVRDSNTTFIETSHKHFKMNHGVYIDVFPIDNYPEKRIKQVLFGAKSKILHFRIRREFYSPNSRKSVKNLLRRIMMAVAKVLYPSREKALRIQDKHFKSIKESHLWINNSGPWGIRHELMPATYYGKGTPIRFEGIEVNAPLEYDKWLTHMYGNYLELPPDEKRVTHHSTELIDISRGYSHYYPDM